MHFYGAQQLADFINTLDVRRPDRREPPFAPEEALTSPTALAEWLANAGLVEAGTRASATDLALARNLRSSLRRLLIDREDRASRRELDTQSALLPMVVAIDGSGRPRLRSVDRGVRAGLAQLLADAVYLVGDGEWDRLKACASPECRWVFVDHSRPRTGRWCSSSACGNREKTRRHRARIRAIGETAHPIGANPTPPSTGPRAP